MRARLALHQAGIAYEPREVALKTKPPQLLSISAKGTVPVLQLESGKVIDESLEVMLWALRQQDPGHWLAGDSEACRELIRQSDTEFKYWLDRYKYHVRHPQFSQIDYRQQGEQFLETLDRLLSPSAKGLLTNQITVADVAIFPFVRQFAGVDREWFDCSDYPHVVQWLRLMENSKDFLAVMQKHDVWN